MNNKLKAIISLSLVFVIGGLVKIVYGNDFSITKNNGYFELASADVPIVVVDTGTGSDSTADGTADGTAGGGGDADSSSCDSCDSASGG